MYQKNIDALIAAWNEGNLEGLDEYVAANTIRRAPASLNSDANSLEELKEVMSDFRVAFPDCRVTINEMFFQDNRGFALWEFEGTNTGEGHFPPTGKRAKISGASISRYEDGKLTEELVYFDALDMMVQLGLAEPPSE